MNFLIVKDILEMEQAIQEAVDRKVKKRYSDSAMLWLLLHPGDGTYTIELRELLETNLRNLDGFAQVWWVYPHRDIGVEIQRFEKKARVPRMEQAAS